MPDSANIITLPTPTASQPCDRPVDLMDVSVATKEVIQAQRDARGVGLGWWVFWGLVFWPVALFVLLPMHVGRKRRAARRVAVQVLLDRQRAEGRS